MDWAQGVNVYLPLEVRAQAVARWLSVPLSAVLHMSVERFMEHEVRMLFIGTMQ